jgi:hypothetical protein
MTDPKWPFIAMNALDMGRDYLATTRYRDIDIEQLAQGQPKGEKLGRAVTKNPSTDGYPPAEIIAVAIMVETAETLLEIWFHGLHERAPEGMHLLGHQQAVAKLLIRDPGHAADIAIDPAGYLKIAEERNKLWRKREAENFQRWRNKLKGDKKDEPIVAGIVILLCGWRRNSQFGSLPDSSVVAELTEMWNKSPYVRDQFPKKYRPLSEPTVRKYLRLGGAIAPAKTRKRPR